MSFFDFVVLTMYATQSSSSGVPRHAIVSPLSRSRFRPSTFASGFRLAGMIDVLSERAPSEDPRLENSPQAPREVAGSGGLPQRGDRRRRRPPLAEPDGIGPASIDSSVCTRLSRSGLRPAVPSPGDARQPHEPDGEQYQRGGRRDLCE